LRARFIHFVNEEDGNGGLMGDVNWVLCDFGGEEERKEVGGGRG